MLEISTFTVVSLVLIVNIIIANLFNWGVRSCKDERYGMIIFVSYFIWLFITFFYLINII